MVGRGHGSDAARHAATAEFLHAAFRAARNLDLHGLLRDAEADSNVALRHTLEFAEDEDFTATGGKRVDGVEQLGDFLAHADLLDDIGPLMNDARQRRISYLVPGENLRPAENPQRHVARGGKKVGPDTRHRGLLPRAQETDVALLNDVVDIGRIGETPPQPRAQIGFVRLHFVGKPAGLVGWEGWHGGSNRR